MRYVIYGWTPEQFTTYNIENGLDPEDIYAYESENLPFFLDLDNDEIELLDYAEIIMESNDETDAKEKLKNYKNKKYRSVQLWDNEEYMFMRC